MTDSPRWCETCKAYGDHHTDRHVPTIDELLTVMEKAIRVLGTPIDLPKRRWWKWWKWWK